MGLLKGTLSLSKYRVVGHIPDNFRNMTDTQLKLFSFQELSTSTNDKSIGWTSLENVLDTDFQYANYSLADYLIFTLRIDRRIISPSLFKLKVFEAEKQLIAEKGKNKIYKEERNEIRDRVRLKLLSKTPATPSFHEICWNVSSGSLIFGSLSEKIREEFEDLFKRTFKLDLIPFVPWDNEYMNIAKTDLPFPGREFLTWLWFKSEERGGAIMIPDVGDIQVTFMRRLVLESGEGLYSETVVCRGFHADLKEGKAALREDKKIKEARLKLGVGTDEYEFTFKADGFQFQTLKLPTTMNLTEEEADKEGRLLERIYLIETAMRTMEQLFFLFLKKRLSPKWSAEEILRVKKWMKE
jgi:recombination associated protein RdgC